MIINDNYNYPLLQLSEIADDPLDLRFYLGEDRIGCMYNKANNFNPIAVIDDGSCVGQKNDFLNTISVDIYPQPATDILYVSINSNYDYNLSEFIEIKNSLGETIGSENIARNTNLIELNVQDLSPGIYYLLLEVNNRLITKQLIVK